MDVQYDWIELHGVRHVAVVPAVDVEAFPFEQSKSSNGTIPCSIQLPMEPQRTCPSGIYYVRTISTWTGCNEPHVLPRIVMFVHRIWCRGKHRNSVVEY